ncbi:YdcF family protein [Tomitella cavernea]|uniref:YdcF family protein n=1 Tax=Tomitella cavernea TaxID=1387982 RepID=A0ABP9CVH8_9ACTN|nr:YdcF family protein [Tomitella cavernea]
MNTGLGVGGTLARWLRRGVAGVLIVGVLLVAGTAFRVWQVARIDDRTPTGAILVLGAAQYNGTPSPVFQARLDMAAELFDEGVAPTIVTVGGKIQGDSTTEAEAGRQYLIEQGVPADSVLAVAVGSDTLGSIDAVSAMLQSRRVDSIVITSDPWHSLRARTMARDSGLEATVAPTRSGPAVTTRSAQIKGIVRETGALLWYQLTHYQADFPDVIKE